MIKAKFLRCIAAVLSITIFSIAIFTSCNGIDPTESNNLQMEIPNPDKTGKVEINSNSNFTVVEDTIGIWDESVEKNFGLIISNEIIYTNSGSITSNETIPEKPSITFGDNTYYTVYTPFTGGDNYRKISYEDTETLDEIWKKMIRFGKYGDGRVWFIRDGDNRYSDHRYGNYYYFDKDFDIVYVRQGKGTLKVRKYVGAVITKYHRGNYSGTVTVGGLYEVLLTKDEVTGNNMDYLNWFMNAHHLGERTKGALEVLVMNLGFTDHHFNEFGVDFYYNTKGNGFYMNNKYLILGMEPEFDNGSSDEYKFNEKRNLSENLWEANFRFVFNNPYNWQLTSHPDKGWQPRNNFFH